MRLRFLSVAGIAVLLLLAGSAMAQNYNGNNDTFTCSSNNGQLQSCRVNTNQPIQFVRQISQSQCVAGQTYGINRGGVWVTNGCRAEFAVVNNQAAYNQGAYNIGYYNNGYYNQGADNGQYRNERDRDHDRRRHDHDRNNRNGAYNNGAYNNGYGPYNNNGYNNNQAYNRGAYNNGYNRGYVGAYNNGRPANYYGNYDDGVTTCSSQNNGSQTFCQTGGSFSSATLQSQNGQCVQGQTWGIDPGTGLWVAGSCSGKWRIQR